MNLLKQISVFTFESEEDIFNKLHRDIIHIYINIIFIKLCRYYLVNRNRRIFNL